MVREDTNHGGDALVGNKKLKDAISGVLQDVK